MRISYEGVILEVDPSDWMHRALIKTAIKKRIGWLIGKPYRRDDYLTCAYRVLSDVTNPVVLDIGCNIGTTALPLARRFPTSKIIAVDAHPTALSRLLRNIQINRIQNVSIVAAAISDTGDMARIFTEPRNSGGNRLSGFEGRTDLAPFKTYDNINVPSLRLDKVAAEMNITHCDMLKIDVEGYELHVLKSLGSDLSPKNYSTVICEFGPEGLRSAGATGWDLVHLMRSHGYRCNNLHDGKAIETPDDVPLLPEFTVTDFLFQAV